MMPDRITELFGEDNYLEFLADYEDYKKMLDEVKGQLANSL